MRGREEAVPHLLVESKLVALAESLVAVEPFLELFGALFFLELRAGGLQQLGPELTGSLQACDLEVCRVAVVLYQRVATPSPVLHKVIPVIDAHVPVLVLLSRLHLAQQLGSGLLANR